jgi:uncharacterized membrane protein YkvA (DUF1232 family)
MGLAAFKNYLRDGEVAMWKKGVALAALLYAVMPFDLVPDMVPLFGWLDDVGVLALAATFVSREVKRHSSVGAQTVSARS